MLRSSTTGVESNSRITGTTAVVLLVLLAVEGATIVRLGSFLKIHEVLGIALIPPVLLKLGSTTWRMVRYYSGAPPYKRKGPPPWLLRLLGPAVGILTIALFGSGVVLMIGSTSVRSEMLTIHKASFVLWFGVMTIHVLGHLRETTRLVPLDWTRSGRERVPGAAMRVSTVVVSMGLGAVLAWILSPKALTLFQWSSQIPHPFK